jgi:8-oxo-dGTP pyrophosphatase MutT (NUDIX family)
MTDLILAAGAVPWRRRVTDETSGSSGTSEVEILLVHRPKYDDWSLPKGKREPGEHILLTAVREVREETGVRSVLGPRLPSVEYLNGAFPKRSDYWSMFSPEEADSGFTAGHEVDEVSWLPLAQARQRLTCPRDAAVIAGLRPRATVPLILLRHASAGQKENWPAVLLHASREGPELARAALHRERAPLRGGLRGDGGHRGRLGASPPPRKFVLRNEPW